jgi:hypothetical protein
MDTSVTPDVSAFAAEAETVSNVNPVTATVNENATSAVTNNNGQKFYTEDDLAKVRSQEKDKLYPQIDKLKEELDLLKRDRQSEVEAKAAEAAAREAAFAEEAKRKQEEELEVRDLLKVKEQEWSEQLEREREERERAFALLERERNFTEITNYRNQRIEQERDNILPELIEMVNGSSSEEIEASIAGLKAKTSSIMDNVQQATQAARRDMTGTRVTTPPNAGPLDIETGTRQFNAQDIANMPIAEYAKYRDQLLSPAAQGRSTGILG